MGTTLKARLKTVLVTLLFGWLASFAVRFAMPRFLGPELFGKYTTADSLAQTIVLAISWGFAEWCSRSFAQDRSRVETEGPTLVHSMLALFVPVLLLLCGVATLLNYPNDIFIIILLTGVSVGFVEFNQVTSRVAQVAGHYDVFASVTKNSRAIWAVVGVSILALAYYQGYSLQNALAAFLIFTFIVEVIRALLILRGTGVRWKQTPNAQKMLAVLSASAPFFLNRIFILIYSRLPAIVLSKIHNPSSQLASPIEEVGYFGVALTLNNILMMFIPAMQSVFVPHLARMKHSNSERYTNDFVNYLFVTLLASGLVTGSMMVGASAVVSILFGSRYQDAWQIVYVFAPTIFITYALVVLTYHIMISGGEKRLTILSSFGVLLTGAASYALIAHGNFRLGAVGAALASTANESFMLVAVLCLIEKKFWWRKDIIFATVVIVTLLGVAAALGIYASRLSTVAQIALTFGYVGLYTSVALVFWRKQLLAINQTWKSPL